MIAPAGVYVSDHDMFCFLVNEDRRIEDGSEDGLRRGFFCWNSEVGASAFGFMSYLYKSVCGNHIVWGAKGVQEIRVRHVGTANSRAFQNLSIELRRYADSSVSDTEARIESARKLVLGATKGDVLDTVFGLTAKHKIGLSQKLVGEAIDLAQVRVDDYGDPRTVWAVSNSLTELSQKISYADERVALDRAAGKLLTVTAF
jgi:hypothetical protein